MAQVSTQSSTPSSNCTLGLADDRSRNAHDCVIDQLSIRTSMTKTNTSFILAAKNAFRRNEFKLVYDKGISLFDLFGEQVGNAILRLNFLPKILKTTRLTILMYTNTLGTVSGLADDRSRNAQWPQSSCLWCGGLCAKAQTF
jgi:hypothetical protein